MNRWVGLILGILLVGVGALLACTSLRVNPLLTLTPTLPLLPTTPLAGTPIATPGAPATTPATPRPQATPSPLPGSISVNYTAADVAQAEARWKSKQVRGYQIEVWSGGITPPPPVYVLQVWQDRIVYAALDYRMDGVHTEKQKSLALDDRDVQAVTVQGLFERARRWLTDIQKGTPPPIDTTVNVEFDVEWGFPRRMSWSAKCPDCVTFSSVQKFIPFELPSAPPTPTPRQ